MPEEKTGLAFSGGGIRSAALSSGVLRRLLHRKVKIDYVSCVSGGNYTAAAYVDWKYRNNKEDDPKWHKKFFEHMRSRVGYICNWKNPLQGILESIILVFLLITVNLLIPCIIYSAGAVPSAYVIDYLLGTVMRKGFNCTDVPQISKGLNNSRKRCTQQFEIDEPEMRKPVYLFFFLFLAFFVSHVIKTIAPLRLRSISRYFKILSGSLLALTYIPWLMEQFTEVLPNWLYTLVIVLSIFFWLGFPPLRGKASLALVAYLYASVVRWRVYETSVIGIEYEEKLFYNLLLVSGFCLWLNPFVGMFSSTAIFTYYKWRLQRAFFTKKSVGLLGCNGISCRDFFPILSCYSPEEHDPAKEPLVMDDLKQVKPQYISNVAVDYWRKKPILKEPSYAIMALSPTENERIDHQPGEPSVEDKLYPKYVNQTDAMVTSAAVMALSPEQEEPFRDLQMLLGLTLRKGIRSNPNESFGCGGELASKILAILIQSIAALPIILLAAIWHSPWDMKNAERAAIASFVVYFIIFFGIALLQTGRRTPCFLDNFARWCHVHLYHVRMLRELFQVNNVGPRPPALLSLSDGGRLEKFGLLPLLKKRLKRILIVDGSFIVNDEDYAKQILKSMDQARKDLNCEFVGFGGRDVKEEMRKTYVDVPRGRQPRYHRFKVQYYDKKPDESYEKVSEGDIMIIAPRYPKYGKPSLDLENNWDQYHQDTGERLDEKEWGKGPVLSEDEVDRLTFCCCECCHSNSKVLQWISKKLCLGFPSTSTVNQFFTSSLYTAYHREGYRACVESGAEEFLKECDATELADIV